MEGHSRPATGYPAGTRPQPGNGYPNSTAGATYPYAAPPPPQPPYYNNNPNPNPYYGQPYPDPRATFFRRLFAISVAFFIVVGTIVFIVWLVLRPRYPQFRVDSVTVSNFNVSSSSSSPLINGNWDVRFTVRNPNHKITLYYDQINAFVFYKSQQLSETNVPPFVQETRNQTAVRATFAAASAFVETWAAEGIKWERSNRGNVNFIVRWAGSVRFKASFWRTRRRFLRVYCGDLVVAISANGTGGNLAAGRGPRECRVGL